MAKTEQIRQIKRRHQRKKKPLEPPPHWRPQTRGDCVDGPRPCPYVGCRYNLLIDVTKAGSLKMPQGEPWAVEEGVPSCALDVAEEGSHSFQQIGDLMGLCRELVSERLQSALAKVRKSPLGKR